jgi:hypothetical protein
LRFDVPPQKTAAAAELRGLRRRQDEWREGNPRIRRLLYGAGEVDDVRGLALGEGVDEDEDIDVALVVRLGARIRPEERYLGYTRAKAIADVARKPRESFENVRRNLQGKGSLAPALILERG